MLSVGPLMGESRGLPGIELLRDRQAYGHLVCLPRIDARHFRSGRTDLLRGRLVTQQNLSHGALPQASHTVGLTEQSIVAGVRADPSRFNTVCTTSSIPQPCPKQMPTGVESPQPASEKGVQPSSRASGTHSPAQQRLHGTHPITKAVVYWVLTKNRWDRARCGQRSGRLQTWLLMISTTRQRLLSQRHGRPPTRKLSR